jgi:adenosylcobinamide kinase/adenosylcobinamide-phosphate guanylyltransferase
MGKMILILGGARSGKSAFAQNLAMQLSEEVIYIATAQALDNEMKTRIENHRKERPNSWITIERPHGIAQLFDQQPPSAPVVLLDCMTILATNLLLEASQDDHDPDEKAASAALEGEISGLLNMIQQGSAAWIIVSNEVGLGLVPAYPLGRIYRDLLGRANQRLAAAADEVYFMVAGIPVPIHSYRTPKMIS